MTGLKRALHHFRSGIEELRSERPDQECPSRLRLSTAINDAKKAAAAVEIEIHVGGQ